MQFVLWNVGKTVNFFTVRALTCWINVRLQEGGGTSLCVPKSFKIFLWRFRSQFNYRYEWKTMGFLSAVKNCVIFCGIFKSATVIKVKVRLEFEAAS